MTDSKRILFLADINSVHTERWVKNLHSRGLQLALFSLSSKTTSWIDELKIPYSCFGLGSEVVRSKGKFTKARYFMATKEVKAFADKFEPDIVHAHYASSYGMLAVQLKAKRSVLSLWGSDVYEFPKRSFVHKQLFKRILSKMDIVCSTSKHMAKEAEKYVKKAYKITPFGIDTARFTPGTKHKEVLTIGTIKSLEEVYGIDRLLKLFAAFIKESYTPVELRIYGKGSQEAALKQLSKELKIEERVFFEGFVEGAELVDAFQSLDIYVALSRSESFGVAILEAQSCGIPVITSNVGGLPEVVADPNFIIDGDNLEAGISCLRQLSDEGVRNSSGEKGRAFVEEHFSEDACVDKLMAIYDQV